MKKKLLFILPFISLVGCSATNSTVSPNYEIGRYNELPLVRVSKLATHKTYLMMSKYGYLNVDGQNVYGEDYEEKYLENVIVWESEPTGSLPLSGNVFSKVNGATFRGWIMYNDNTYPDYLTQVPSVNESIVYAIFDGPKPEDIKTLTYTVIELPSWVFDDECILFAWVWGGGAGNGEWAGLTYTDDTHKSATFDTYSDITAFLLVRCIKGTTTPNWDIREDVPGRIYNQTDDISVSSSSKRIYEASSWKGYY